MTHDAETVERHANTARNLILNKTLTDLDRIINDHDPEVDTSINNGVWDRLDKMAVDIEALSAMPPKEVSVQEAVAALTEILGGTEPEYHYQGMGCGLEDRNITDRYEAMAFGWEQAIERVYSEVVNPATEALRALSEGKA